jgi:hypothetical protein
MRFDEAAQERLDARGLAAPHREARRAAHLNLGCEAVYGEAKRAETPSEFAAEIEKAQMQPRAGADAHGSRLDSSLWHGICCSCRIETSAIMRDMRFGANMRKREKSPTSGRRDVRDAFAAY